MSVRCFCGDDPCDSTSPPCGCGEEHASVPRAAGRLCRDCDIDLFHAHQGSMTQAEIDKVRADVEREPPGGLREMRLAFYTRQAIPEPERLECVERAAQLEAWAAAAGPETTP